MIYIMYGRRRRRRRARPSPNDAAHVFELDQRYFVAVIEPHLIVRRTVLDILCRVDYVKCRKLEPYERALDALAERQPDRRLVIGADAFLDKRADRRSFRLALRPLDVVKRGHRFFDKKYLFHAGMIIPPQYALVNIRAAILYTRTVRRFGRLRDNNTVRCYNTRQIPQAKTDRQFYRRFLLQRGGLVLSVVRIPNNNILFDFDAVRELIYNVVSEYKPQ